MKDKEGNRIHNYGNREPQAGTLGDCIGSNKHAKDAEEYACLCEGYSHRPAPPGQKRQMFCSICQAEHCYFRAYMTPEQVRKEKPRLPERRRQVGFESSGEPWTDLANALVNRIIDDIEGYDIKLGLRPDEYRTQKRKIMRDAETFLASPIGQYFLDGCTALDASITGTEVVERLKTRRRQK